MNRIVTKIAEIDSGRSRSIQGDYDFYEKANPARGEPGGAVSRVSEAMFAKEQRFIDPLRPHAAKAAQVQSGSGARQDRAGGAAQEAGGGELRSRRRRAQATRWRCSEGVSKAYGSRVVHKDFLDDRPSG